VKGLVTAVTVVGTMGAVALAGGAALGGCGGSPTTAAQQARTWASNAGFGSSTSQLDGDLARLSSLATDSAAVRRTDCDVLVTDALNANEQLPTPDGSLTGLLSQAYGAAASAGRDCFAGGARLALTGPQAQRARTALVEAQARYDSLTSTLGASS